MKYSLLFFSLFSSLLFAHLEHEANSQGVLSPAAAQIFKNQVTIRSEGGYRFIDSNFTILERNRRSQFLQKTGTQWPQRKTGSSILTQIYIALAST